MKDQQFVALNGGPGFPFTNAVSLVVNCYSQEEIDYFWDKLAAEGGEPNVWMAPGQIRHAVADRAEPNLGMAGRR